MKRRKTCRVCWSKNLVKVFDLGMTPLANSYLSKEDLDKPEVFYPLILNRCSDCGNYQLAHVVDSETLFSNYLYESSTSPVFVKHFKDFAFDMGKKDFVVDIGSNDGILLKPFQDMGCKVLGIEPATNLNSSVPMISMFWSSKLGKVLAGQYGKADLITATNVFAHIDDLDDVIKGVKNLLTPNGIFVIEVTDVEKMLKDGTFDLIYHEHVNYWGKDTIRKFFELRNMEVTEIEDIPTHGGSLRVYARILK